MHPAQAKCLNDDPPIAQIHQDIKDTGVHTRSQLQQEHLAAGLGQKPGRAGDPGQHGLIQLQPHSRDPSHIVAVDAFKGGKARGPDLHCPAAQHNLPVKCQKHPRLAGSCHGKGRAEIGGRIGEKIGQRQLRTREYHRQVDIL